MTGVDKLPGWCYARSMTTKQNQPKSFLDSVLDEIDAMIDGQIRCGFISVISVQGDRMAEAITQGIANRAPATDGLRIRRAEVSGRARFSSRTHFYLTWG